MRDALRAARPSRAAHLRALAWAMASVMAPWAALPGCATRAPAPSADVQPGAVLAMEPGQSARLPDGGSLGYVGLRSDSRCPPAVACVHAGWVELDFVHRPARGAPTAIVLSTREGAPAVDAGRWRLELVEVGRGASPLAHLRASAAPE